MADAAASTQTLHWLIRGRVQAVGFRAATRRQALALGLRGYARNLPDGRVEVVAHGAAAALQQLHAWLQHGPPSARVQEILCDSLPPRPGDDGFDVR